jgi:hypothetical protein
MAQNKAPKPVILKVCTTDPLKKRFKEKYGDRYMSKRINVLMRADLNNELIITIKSKDNG